MAEEQGSGFAPGTYVTGRYGLKPVRLLGPDDRIKNGPLSYAKITGTEKSGKARVVTVQAGGNIGITLTPDRNIFARECTEDESGHMVFLSPEWITAGDLTEQYSVGYCLDCPITEDNRISPGEAEKIAAFAQENGYFPEGSFDVSEADRKLIFMKLIWSASNAVSRGRGSYVALPVKSEPTAYILARMARDCYQAAVDIVKLKDENGCRVFEVRILINTQAAGSYCEDNVVWQPVRGVIDTGSTADVYDLKTDSGNVCIMNGIICMA